MSFSDQVYIHSNRTAPEQSLSSHFKLAVGRFVCTVLSCSVVSNPLRPRGL